MYFKMLSTRLNKRLYLLCEIVSPTMKRSIPQAQKGACPQNVINMTTEYRPLTITFELVTQTERKECAHTLNPWNARCLCEELRSVLALSISAFLEPFCKRES